MMLGQILFFTIGGSMRGRPAHTIDEMVRGSVLSATLILVVILLVEWWGTAQIEVADISVLKARFLPKWHSYVTGPELVERLAYLAATVAAVPVILFVGWLTHCDIPTSRPRFLAPLLIVIAWAIFYGLLQQRFLATVALGWDSTDDVRDRSFLVVLTIALAIAAATVTDPGLQAIHRIKGLWMVRTYTAVLIILILTLFGLLRLRTAEMVAGDLHFEAAYYSVTQVAAGRTTLADLPAQYGLYAELLRPALLLIGYSVLTFSALMAALQVVGVLALMSSVDRLIRLPAVRFLTMLTVLVFIGSTWLALAQPKGYEYLQIWPIRFIFPAMSLWLFLRFGRGGWRSIAGLGALDGVAILWNLETGISAIGALVACLLADFAFGPAAARRNNALRMLAGLSAAIAVIIAFGAYLWVKSGSLIDPAELWKYQKIFYFSGFGMLPMPLSPHAWMSVAALYLIALTTGLTAKLAGKDSCRTDALQFLAVLGIGLFAYYQGRSHDIVLSFVMWPAVLIAFVFLDGMLRALKSGTLSSSARVAAVPIIAFGLISCTTWIVDGHNLPRIGRDIVRSIASRAGSPTAAVADFIKSKVGSDSEAVIIGPAQAVLYGETGLVSPIGGPGQVEMLLQEDLDRSLVALRKRTPRHVFIALEPDGTVPQTYVPALSGYRLVSRSAGMLYFAPCALRAGEVCGGAPS